MTVNIGGRECVRGIDIAVYQPNVDWAVVKQHRDFAFIKATEGTSYVDPKFAQHRNGATAVGLPLGAYHYLQTSDGTAQARNFLRATNNYAGFQLPVAVDFEQGGVSAPIANAFIAEIERTIGKPWVGPTGEPVACIFYTGNYFLPNGRDASWARMDLWVAAYTNRNYPNPGPEPQFLPVPGARFPWSTWSVWQCNGGDGRCPGVGGGTTPCDQNVGTVEWFNRVLQRGDTPVQSEEDDDLSYSKWSDDEQWAEANAVAGLIVGKTLTDKVIPDVTLTTLNEKIDKLAVGTVTVVANAVAELKAAVASATNGAAVDVEAEAKAIADELARRLED